MKIRTHRAGNTPGELGIREAQRQTARDPDQFRTSIEHLRLFDTHQVWWVTDPAEHSELGDICFKADLRSIQLQVIGVKRLLPELTLYMNEENAKRDAKLRLHERDTK